MTAATTNEEKREPIPGVDRPMTPEEKELRLKFEAKAGAVVLSPACACGWTGDEPCAAGAGCPKCGARIGTPKAKAKRKRARG